MRSKLLLWKLKLLLEKCHSGRWVRERLRGGRGFRVHLKWGFNNCSIVRCQKHKSISKRCITRQNSNLLTFWGQSTITRLSSRFVQKSRHQFTAGGRQQRCLVCRCSDADIGLYIYSLPSKHFPDKALTIDLFRLFILFFHYKSRDNTQEDWFFVLLIKKSACKHEYVCMPSF